MSDGEAVAELEISPPERIAIGKGNAFAIGGYAYHRSERTRRLSVRVGDSLQPVERSRLPREDVWARLEGADPSRPNAYRSGFVGICDLSALRRPEAVELALVIELAGGRTRELPLGSIGADPGLPEPDAPTPAFPAAQGPRVAICMATYDPPAELLRQQLASIREQTHANWICVVSDDGSRQECFERLLEATGDDPRFAVSRNPKRRGFYRNFERALSMAPPEADFVTLCDQDDRWHPDKLARLLDRIGHRELVYSDARVVSSEGDVVHPSYWTSRRNNHTNFASLLLANSVTGAASLFPRGLLDDALPFPPALHEPFHDHWLAVVALARGEIAYIDEPLYDYVQHGGAVIGHSGANRRGRRVSRQLIERLRNPGDGSRVAYFYNWHQHLLFDEVLRLRCWDRMTPSKRRTLRRLLAADGGIVGLPWLLARRARRLWGHDETLDRELLYAYALGRRRAVSALNLGRRRPGRLLPRDASIPAPPQDH